MFARYLYLLCLLMIVYTNTNGAPLITGTDFTLKKANLHITYYADSTNTLDYRQLLLRTNAFRTDPAHSMNFGYTDHTYWIRLEVQNEGRPQNFVYELANVYLDVAELYECRNGILSTKKDRLQMYRNQADGTLLKTSLLHTFRLETGEKVVFLLKAKAITSLSTLITIYTDTAFRDHTKLLLLRYSVFTGIIVIAFFFAMFLFFIIRDRVYLFYGGYALSFWLAVISLRGYLFDTPLSGRFDIRQVVVFFILFFALKFTERFLSIKEYHPRAAYLIRLTHGFLLLCFFVFICHAAGIISLYTNRYWMMTAAVMYNILLALSVITIGFCIVAAIRRRYPPGWFYLVSFLPLLGITLLILLSNFSLIPYSDLFGSYYVFACSFEFSVLFFGLIYRFKAYKDEKEQLLREYANVQKELVSTLVTGQEMERKRISEELHDSLGQWLTVTQLHVNSLSADHITQSGLDQVKKDIERSIIELRHISHNMMPVALIHGGIGPAIDELVTAINRAGSLHVTHYYDEALKILPDKQTEFALYRIIQESLTNIVRHSGATDASVQLTLNNDRIQLMIEDNGCGFDPDAANYGKGLKNILSRLQVLGYGKFEISSSPGKGTLLFADLPAVK